MILEHSNLEEFTNPVDYDNEHKLGMAPLIAFYRAVVADSGGPVLDLACGTGIVSIALAEAGYEVIGIDITPAMIAYARQKAHGLPITWITQDVREVALDRLFSTIIMTGNAFQACLTSADQHALLEVVSRHLAPGGVFAFETRNPRAEDLISTDAEEPWGTYTDSLGRHVAVSGLQQYDAATQLMHWTTYRRWEAEGIPMNSVTRIATLYTGLDDLLSLIHAHGLTTTEVYGTWDRAAHTPESAMIVAVCRRNNAAGGDMA